MIDKDKHISQSTTIRGASLLLTVALTRIFARYLPGEIAAQLAAGVADESIAVVLSLAFLATAAGRIRAGGVTIKPKRRRRGPGPVAGAMLAALALSSCASAWPSACSLSPAGRSCKCQRYKIAGVKMPDGRIQVSQLCDGDPLPIIVLSRDVTATR